MSSLNKMKQFNLGRFVLTADHEEQVSFFAISERVSAGRSRLLMWRNDVGFVARQVWEDADSDLQTNKAIDLIEFPWTELRVDLQNYQEEIPPALRREVLRILNNHPSI
jgi:hypothetical protein